MKDLLFSSFCQILIEMYLMADCLIFIIVFITTSKSELMIQCMSGCSKMLYLKMWRYKNTFWYVVLICNILCIIHYTGWSWTVVRSGKGSCIVALVLRPQGQRCWCCIGLCFVPHTEIYPRIIHSIRFIGSWCNPTWKWVTPTEEDDDLLAASIIFLCFLLDIHWRFWTQ